MTRARKVLAHCDDDGRQVAPATRQAIETIYCDGGTVQALCEGAREVGIRFDPLLSDEENHRAACVAMLRAQDWQGAWVGASLCSLRHRTRYVWVLL